MTDRTCCGLILKLGTVKMAPMFSNQATKSNAMMKTVKIIKHSKMADVFSSNYSVHEMAGGNFLWQLLGDGQEQDPKPNPHRWPTEKP